MGKTILYIEDHPKMVDGTIDTLKRINGVESVYWASNGIEGMEKVKELNPDLVLLDINLPGKNGKQVAQEIKEYNPNTIVLAFTGHEYTTVLNSLLEAGVSGLLEKSAADPDIIRAIEALFSGYSLVPTQVFKAMRFDVGYYEPAVEAIGTELDNKEQKLFELVGKGLTNKKIAEMIMWSEKKVEADIQKLARKLGVPGKQAKQSIQELYLKANGQTL